MAEKDKGKEKEKSGLKFPKPEKKSGKGKKPAKKGAEK